MANTAMLVTPESRAMRSSAPVRVDFPDPGAPVIPSV
jgi:hypothetical protein